jgi:stage V sporulation protein SpoVS
METKVTEERILIKVAATSSASKVAGAIAAMLRQHKGVDVQAVGAAAINRAVQAISLASDYVAKEKEISSPIFAIHSVTLESTEPNTHLVGYKFSNI